MYVDSAYVSSSHTSLHHILAQSHTHTHIYICTHTHTIILSHIHTQPPSQTPTHTRVKDLKQIAKKHNPDSTLQFVSLIYLHCSLTRLFHQPSTGYSITISNFHQPSTGYSITTWTLEAGFPTSKAFLCHSWKNKGSTIKKNLHEKIVDLPKSFKIIICFTIFFHSNTYTNISFFKFQMCNVDLQSPQKTTATPHYTPTI